MNTLRAIDSYIQRAVNAAAFFMMRLLNVTRSFLSYTVGLCIVGVYVLEFFTDKTRPWTSLLCASIWLAHTYAANHNDALAESSGVQIAPSPEWHKPAMWIIFLLPKAAILDRVAWILLLLLEYLSNVPNKPPPQKKKQPAQQLAPAQ